MKKENKILSWFYERFNRKSKIPFSRNSWTLDIPYYEEKYGIEITFPTQFLSAEVAARMKEEDPEFFERGCADIHYPGHWLHRDCFRHLMVIPVNNNEEVKWKEDKEIEGKIDWATYDWSYCEGCSTFNNFKEHGKVPETYGEKRVFKIPVGKQSKEESRKALSELMADYKKDISFDDTTGELSVNGKPLMPFEKEYWF